MRLLFGNDWTEFLTEIRNAQSELGDPKNLWFRGHRDASYYLLPSLLRYKNGIYKEKELFHKFKRFAERIFSHRESQWETLFDMQHYWIPTRLLDWTETFGIALFFAVHNNQNTDAAIYLIDPDKLNEKSGKSGVIRLPHEEKEFSYQNIYWHNNPFRPSAPIAIEPIFNNDRMIAQRAMFTVHDNDTHPIEDKFPDAIKKITMPAHLLPSAREFLNLTNINEYSVYPDLAGIADYLRNSSDLK